MKQDYLLLQEKTEDGFKHRLIDEITGEIVANDTIEVVNYLYDLKDKDYQLNTEEYEKSVKLINN